MNTGIVQSLSQGGVANTGGVGGTNPLGKDAFLKLLTTQLQFQDPLKPLNSTEFIAQLTQLTQLEETQKMSSVLADATRQIGELSNYSAAGLIGKQVRVLGGSVRVTEGESTSLTYSIPEKIRSGIMDIADSTGTIIQTFDLGVQSAGMHAIIWDGKDANGAAVPSGKYLYRVAAENAEGNLVPASTYAQGQVSGITYDNGIAYLMVNGEPVPASDIVQINN